MLLHCWWHLRPIPQRRFLLLSGYTVSFCAYSVKRSSGLPSYSCLVLFLLACLLVSCDPSSSYVLSTNYAPLEIFCHFPIITVLSAIIFHPSCRPLVFHQSFIRDLLSTNLFASCWKQPLPPLLTCASKVKSNTCLEWLWIVHFFWPCTVDLVNVSNGGRGSQEYN